jgi:serpin B
MALGMTMNGAAGQTFDEMRAALAFGTRPAAEINASYRSLIDMLRALDPTVDFRIANSIWYRAGFPFEQTFLDESRQFFDARVSGLDFASSKRGALHQRLGQQSTNGKIDKIVDGPIPNDVVMYLINAIYFNGSWTTRFDRNQTRTEQFHTIGGTTAPIAMMRRTDTIRVAETADAQVVDLPYGGGAYTMTILLPKEGKSLRDVVATLTADAWQAAVTGATARSVELQMPKFTLRWEALLNDPLQALGMRQAFQGDVADFTRMSRDAGNPLYISKVKQKAFVDVHEEGTEAAAVTSVEIRVTCACGPSGHSDRSAVRVRHPRAPLGHDPLPRENRSSRPRDRNAGRATRPSSGTPRTIPSTRRSSTKYRPATSRIAAAVTARHLVRRTR